MQLKAENLGFGYRKDEWIFRNKDFEIESGEIVGISGYSGCGKTTFGKVLCSYYKPIEGSLLLDSNEITLKDYNPIQMIFQHPEKSVNPRWKMKRILEEAYTPSEDILDMLGIEADWMDRWPIELSGGELQRFCVARALSPETKFIIADEMTTMLDGITKAKIWESLLEISKAMNIGLVVISHEKELLKKLCDRIEPFE